MRTIRAAGFLASALVLALPAGAQVREQVVPQTRKRLILVEPKGPPPITAQEEEHLRAFFTPTAAERDQARAYAAGVRETFRRARAQLGVIAARPTRRAIEADRMAVRGAGPPPSERITRMIEHALAAGTPTLEIEAGTLSVPLAMEWAEKLGGNDFELLALLCMELRSKDEPLARALWARGVRTPSVRRDAWAIGPQNPKALDHALQNLWDGIPGDEAWENALFAVAAETGEHFALYELAWSRFDAAADDAARARALLLVAALARDGIGASTAPFPRKLTVAAAQLAAGTGDDATIARAAVAIEWRPALGPQAPRSGLFATRALERLPTDSTREVWVYAASAELHWDPDAAIARLMPLFDEDATGGASRSRASAGCLGSACGLLARAHAEKGNLEEGLRWLIRWRDDYGAATLEPPGPRPRGVCGTGEPWAVLPQTLEAWKTELAARKAKAAAR